jgi:hypothetical protein
MFSPPFRAYYEVDTAKRDLFEFQQSSLEMVTERISRALEPTTAKLNKAKLNELRGLAKVASSSLEKLFLSN